MIKYKKSAFTLSEILITLGVIGVVSAMTLPTLVNNYQKKVTAYRLKATYSMISQAIKMSEVDNGPLATWDTSMINNYSKQKSFADTYIMSYLKNIKECSKMTSCLGENRYRLNGSKYNLDSEDKRPTYILNNGVVISLTIIDVQKCIQIQVDINGKQPPNTIGKDEFIIVANIGTGNNLIAKNQQAGKIVFFGSGNTLNHLKNDSTYGCNKEANGHNCGAWIMQNGWKIPDEYPW